MGLKVLQLLLQGSDNDKFFAGRHNAALSKALYNVKGFTLCRALALSIYVMHCFHGDYTLRKWKTAAL